MINNLRELTDVGFAIFCFLLAALIIGFVVYCIYDGIAHPEKVKANMERQQREKAAKAAAPVRCPKCGSTQITAVTRKWSPVTGFLTNKADRVCLSCKHRF